MERMIGSVDDEQFGAFAELCTERPEKLQLRQRIARALEKKQRHGHIRKMLAALRAGPAGGMQRESEKIKPRTPSSGALAAAKDVMRPPIDFPPANSGKSPACFFAAVTAARTVSVSTLSESGRLVRFSV